MISPKVIVDIKNESACYADRKILDNISLRIMEGERIALIGPSGVGKTTLLKKIYTKTNDSASFIHQNYSLISQLSVFHNIFMGRLDFNSTFYNLLNLLIPTKKEKFHISDIARRLRIDDYLFKKTGRLSGGEQQRVAIGRALYRGSEVVIADEPVSSLDPVKSTEALQILVKETNTVISALHNIQQAQKYFTRFIGLKENKILFDLPKKDVKDSDIKELYKQ